MKAVIVPPQKPEQYELKIQKALDGRIFVYDHPDIDIVIHPAKGKVITFPKNEMSEYVYGSQDILFKYLVKRGLIEPDSIQGGSVYYSMEGRLIIPEKENKVNENDLILYNIGKFLEEENKYFKAEEEYHRKMNHRLFNPEDEESTDLGDVEQKELKGVIPQGGRPFSYGNMGGLFSG